MESAPSELKYTKTHEWVRLEGDDIAVVGITDHAQALLGDMVFVELPEVDDVISAGDEAGVVESVKAASDIYAPVSGDIVAVNEELVDSPSLVNSDPYSDGWIIKIKMSDPSELEDLMDAATYQAEMESEE